MYSTFIANTTMRMLQSNSPIREKQTLYPWFTFHFDGVQFALAVRNKSASERNRIQHIQRTETSVYRIARAVSDFYANWNA
ncbi:hypothetical protein T11_12529 [Trichinella zimbabwensis]|uniref:Uncharacterized protein n=1 Tax=Trichinella zimbabwensis TaxID=268475 RepID=A0A0V1H121_9BILA|nr:hypothetical protein T11_12529 [Trichinella zimbabwensis]